jgi:hypothetical protein
MVIWLREVENADYPHCRCLADYNIAAHFMIFCFDHIDCDPYYNWAVDRDKFV